MKEKTKYLLTIIVTFTIGVMGTLLTLKECGLLEERIVDNRMKE